MHCFTFIHPTKKLITTITAISLTSFMGRLIVLLKNRLDFKLFKKHNSIVVSTTNFVLSTTYLLYIRAQLTFLLVAYERNYSSPTCMYM